MTVDYSEEDIIKDGKLSRKHQEPAKNGQLYMQIILRYCMPVLSRASGAYFLP